MKLRQLLAGVLILALFGAVAAACRARREAETETSGTASATEADTAPTEETAETTALPAQTEPVTAADGLTEDVNFLPVAMDKAAVLSFYTEAVNNVKRRCPGYTKTQTQAVENVTAGKGTVQVANRILALVATELLKSSGDPNNTVTVPPHADVQVRQTFPVYNESYGCNLKDLSLIESASCYTDGEVYRVVITVKETLNPEPGEGEFSKILTPIERKNVASGILTYLPVLDLDQYLFDFNYTNNEVVCYIDRESGRLLSLTQKMVINVDIDIDLDLILFKTDFVEAHGQVINKLEYTDFNWTA